MITFPTLIASVVLFAFLVIPGFLLGKAKLIERSALVSMTNVLMYVAMPFLVFSKLVSPDTDLRSISIPDILICTVVPAVMILGGFFFAMLVFRKKRDRVEKGVLLFCSVMPNCGFLGIPLAEVLFPTRPEVAVYLSLYNVVSTFLLLTVGVYVMSGDKRDISLKRAVLSPIMAAIVLGVIASLTGVVRYVPQIETYSGILASLTTPLSMLVLGVELSSLKLRRLILTPSLYVTAALKLVLSPAVAVLILFLLRLCGLPLSAPLMAAIFLATAVSTAASAPAMAKKYGCDGELAAILTLGTTILCTLTLPLLYMLAGLILPL